MKKVKLLMMALIMCFVSNLTFSQTKFDIDEYTGDTTYKTKYQNIDYLISYDGYSVKATYQTNTKNYYLYQSIKVNGVMSVSSGSEIWIKLKDSTEIILVNNEYQITSSYYNTSTKSYVHTFSFKNIISEENLKSLSNSEINVIRIFTNDGYINFAKPIESSSKLSAYNFYLKSITKFQTKLKELIETVNK